MIIKKINHQRYVVYTCLDGIPMAAFPSEDLAKEFIKGERARNVKAVEEARQHIIDTAYRIKSRKRGRHTNNRMYEDKRKILLLVNRNPKKSSTKAYKRFTLYTNGMTVQAFLKAGGTMADINWDVRHKFIQLT